tara:strand:+ start:186 stop:779 length:594 start_codon:yes stop_codon:yes gene_type:complete
MKRDWFCLSNKSISHGDYSLIAVQSRDIEQIRIWRNMQISVLRQSSPISREEQLNYYKDKIFPSMRLKEPLNILMSFLMKGELIGYGGLVHLNWHDRRGEISFLLNPLFTQDKMIYKEKHIIFLRLLSILAFKDLGFNKIFTETWATRVPHINNLEAFGFKLEGILRKHVLINGRYEDALIHGCLATNYKIKAHYEK